MNTAKHTPGPWECKPSNAERYSRYIAPVNLKSWPYDVIAYMPEAYGDKCTFPGSHNANARLIAAAPDFLEALEIIAGTDPIDAALDPQRAVRVARAAIAKATEGGAA